MPETTDPKTPSGPRPSGASLFEPLVQRGLTARNRIAVSPMCMYSCEDGFASDWHLVHLGSRAVGGAGFVLTEATAVLPEGRISPHDLGIWKDEHVSALRRVAEFVAAHGAIPGIQLAHAGRKGSTRRQWDGGGIARTEHGGWEPVSSTGEPFADGWPRPRELDPAGIERVIEAFRAAARRALAAGFQLAEVHGAHGYLAHQFYSPLVNRRTDAWGGSFENRVRFVLELTRAVRAEWPRELPVWVRLSATDWADGGWDVEQTVRLADLLKAEGVDLVDVSSGGGVAHQKITVGPGYQVPFAAQVRRQAGIPTGAVGLITRPDQADAIVRSGEADLVLLAREELRDPYWPLHAARELGVDVNWPVQYERGKPRA